MQREKCYLYYVFNDTCHDMEFDGYIGITNNPEWRWYQHRKKKRFPEDSQLVVIHEGHRDECRKIERLLRPVSFIGWNIWPGGGHTPRGPKSETTKAKISESLKGRKVPPDIVEKTASKLRGRKRPPEVVEKYSASQRGKPKNPESIEKMRESRKGQISWNKGIPMRDSTKKKLSSRLKGFQPDWKMMRCHCGIECNIGTYTRWHGERCKKGGTQ